MEHKTSLHFVKLVCYDKTISENLVQKYLNIEKIIFKVVQVKFLAMHIIIFLIRNVLNIFMEQVS